MHFTGALVKEKMPDAITVFIGPCAAKRKEGILDEVIDYVLTFDELNALMEAHEIDLLKCEPAQIMESAKWQGRNFPVSGGTTKAIKSHIDGRAEMKPLLIDGLTAKSIKLLKVYAKGVCPGNFIEVMSCEGGCVGGPSVIADPRISTAKIGNFVQATESEQKQK